MKVIRILPFITTIFIMCCIFVFSSQPAGQSNMTSKGTLRSIINILPNTKDLTEAEKNEICIKWNHTIRKTAHFSIYLMLGISAAAMMLSINPKRKIYSIIVGTFLICFLYACTDEFHQKFVPGRGPQFSDVVIDSTGGIFGAVFFSLCLLIYRRNKGVGIND